MIEPFFETSACVRIARVIEGLAVDAFSEWGPYRRVFVCNWRRQPGVCTPPGMLVQTSLVIPEQLPPRVCIQLVLNQVRETNLAIDTLRSAGFNVYSPLAQTEGVA